MGELLDAVKATIEAPQLIQRSLRSFTTVYYYRLSGRRFHRAQDVYVSVVVERNDETKAGRVKTAHLLREMRPGGGETLWIKRD
jgi:hypothetical protein